MKVPANWIHYIIIIIKTAIAIHLDSPFQKHLKPYSISYDTRQRYPFLSLFTVTQQKWVEDGGCVIKQGRVGLEGEGVGGVVTGALVAVTPDEEIGRAACREGV